MAALGSQTTRLASFTETAASIGPRQLYGRPKFATDLGRAIAGQAVESEENCDHCVTTP